MREIGCSNFDRPRVDAAADASAAKGTAAFVTLQNQLSLLDRRQQEDTIASAERHGLGILPYFPLASGMLTGKFQRGTPPPEGTRLSQLPEDRAKKVFDDRAFDTVERLTAFAAERDHSLLELAVSWLACLPQMASVIAGATAPEQVRSNVAAAGWKLSDGRDGRGRHPRPPVAVPHGRAASLSPLMSVLVPTDLDRALAALDREPDALVLAGGTDVMVAVNAGWLRFDSVVALRAIDELKQVEVDADRGLVRIGAGVTYTRLLAGDVVSTVPALAQAARTVGSPQIRNAGTIGGNLATASPAGDTLPVLVALDARVEVASVAGRRTVPVQELLTGPKRTSLRPGELITAVVGPDRAGPPGVPEGRRAQRDGDRRRVGGCGGRSRPPVGGDRARLGRPGAAPGPGRRGVDGRAARLA